MYLNQFKSLLIICAALISWISPREILAGTITDTTEAPTTCRAGMRGIFFNPRVPDDPNPDSWLLEYHLHKDAIHQDLCELVETTGVNFIDFQVLIPWTLADPKKPPTDKCHLEDWANLQTLDNLVEFLDACGDLGIQAEIDLATNMWPPFTVDTKAHIANSRWWPVPDETPWTESAVWYTQIIEFVEARVRDAKVIALWSMMGNHQWGGAEPVLWEDPAHPEVAVLTGEFVKYCWPRFRDAGSRPKGTPIALPIFENRGRWKDRPSTDRLKAVIHLKKWLVDDLAMPPDYWVLTTYVHSDPASDGVCYLDEVMEILGRENASRIISTDFKATGADLSSTLIDTTGLSFNKRIEWNIRKCDEYGFAGWWMWCYRDTPKDTTGIRTTSGEWKMDLVSILKSSGSLSEH